MVRGHVRPLSSNSNKMVVKGNVSMADIHHVLPQQALSLWYRPTRLLQGPVRRYRARLTLR